MNDDLKSGPRNVPGERFASPFDVPHATPVERDAHAEERLELLRCDPFEPVERSTPRRETA